VHDQIKKSCPVVRTVNLIAGLCIWYLIVGASFFKKWQETGGKVGASIKPAKVSWLLVISLSCIDK